jgi:hypothetical protein
MGYLLWQDIYNYADYEPSESDCIAHFRCLTVRKRRSAEVEEGGKVDSVCRNGGRTSVVRYHDSLDDDRSCFAPRSFGICGCSERNTSSLSD